MGASPKASSACSQAGFVSEDEAEESLARTASRMRAAIWEAASSVKVMATIW